MHYKPRVYREQFLQNAHSQAPRCACARTVGWQQSCYLTVRARADGTSGVEGDILCLVLLSQHCANCQRSQSLVWPVWHQQLLHLSVCKTWLPTAVSAVQLSAGGTSAHLKQLFAGNVMLTDGAASWVHTTCACGKKGAASGNCQGASTPISVNVNCRTVNVQFIRPHIAPVCIVNCLIVRCSPEYPLGIVVPSWWYACPFHLVMCNHLNARYGGKQIANGGPVPWPARSPDLIPPHYFLCRHLVTLRHSCVTRPRYGPLHSGCLRCNYKHAWWLWTCSAVSVTPAHAVF
jgi:hypothetical protein